jgi:ATP-binding cassette subfamily B (MDR/TAP) protein 1
VAIAFEAIDSIRTIKIFGLEQDTIATFQRALRGPYKSQLLDGHGVQCQQRGIRVDILVGRGRDPGQHTQTQFFIVLPALLFAAQSGGQMFSTRRILHETVDEYYSAGTEGLNHLSRR